MLKKNLDFKHVLNILYLMLRLIHLMKLVSNMEVLISTYIICFTYYTKWFVNFVVYWLLLGSSDDSRFSDENWPKIEFVFTFSIEEWNEIKPQEVVYRLNDKNRPKQNSKTKFALPKNMWTPVLAEHFWIHNTQLSCCLSFRRADVRPTGVNFLTVVGRCNVCDSHFKGIVENKPLENARYFLNNIDCFNILLKFFYYF